jgi:hypothetical protein
MIRTTILTGLFVLLAADGVQAQPFARWADRRACQNNSYSQCYGQQQARFPRLAAIAQPQGFMMPGYQLPIADRFPAARFAGYGLSTVFMVMAFLPPSYDVIGFGAPIAIRAAHVLLNGSPTPGRPIMTAGWVANPYAVQGVQWIQMRRRGIIPGIDYPVNPPLDGTNTPVLIRRNYGEVVGYAP